MMVNRRGLGKGMGCGYRNLVPKDPLVHGLSAKGVKTKLYDARQIGNVGFKIQETGDRWTLYVTEPSKIKGKKRWSKIQTSYDAKFLQKVMLNQPEFKGKKKTLNAYGDEPIEVITKGNKRAEIFIDTDPMNPREWDNFGNMVAFHKRYDLGDKTDLKSDMFDSWSELHDYLVKEKKAEIVLPIYLYDHSGLRMKVGSFAGLLPQGHAEFDSGQVGYVYATAKEIKDNFQVKRITPSILKKAEEVLRGEVETYDQYLMGDVYGYRVVEKQKADFKIRGMKPIEQEKDIDSCWGFYGIDSVRQEVNAILNQKKR